MQYYLMYLFEIFKWERMCYNFQLKPFKKWRLWLWLRLWSHFCHPLQSSWNKRLAQVSPWILGTQRANKLPKGATVPNVCVSALGSFLVRPGRSLSLVPRLHFAWAPCSLGPAECKIGLSERQKVPASSCFVAYKEERLVCGSLWKLTVDLKMHG